MQTTDNTLSETSAEATGSPSFPIAGGSLDLGLASDRNADLESDAEEPSILAIQSRWGLRPR